jgi:hypothetical protein
MSPIRVVFEACRATSETSKYGVDIFCLFDDLHHYLMIQRSRLKKAGSFGDIHFECDGQGWGGYDVIKSLQVAEGRLQIRLDPAARDAENFDNRLEYDIGLAMPPTSWATHEAFLRNMFAGTPFFVQPF